MFNTQSNDQPLSMNLDRSQTIVSQSLRNVDFGKTNNKPAITPVVNKPTLPTNPFVKSGQPNAIVPDSLKAGYKEAPPIPTAEDADKANTWLDNNHQIIAGNTTGIEKANHDDMHSKAKDVVDAVKTGQISPEDAQEAVKQSPEWQSSPVWSGALMGGLALMSGKDPLEAMQIAQQESGRQGMVNSLTGNIDELQKHYTMDSIQAAISAKDRSLLVPRSMTLEEKQAAGQKAQEAENAEWERRNKITSDEADQRQQRSQELQFKMQSLREDAQKRKEDAKTEADRQKADTQEFNKGVTAFQAADRKNNTQFSSRLTTFDAAKNSLEGIDDPKITPQEKSARFMNALEQMYKGINPSSTGEITPDKLEELAGIRNVFTKVGNKISTSLTGAPLDAAIKQVKANLDVEKNSTAKAIESNVYQSVDNMIAATGDPDKALKIANTGQHRVKVTKEGYDAWLKSQENGESAEQPAAKTGALSSGSASQPAPAPSASTSTSGASNVRVATRDPKTGKLVFK